MAADIDRDSSSGQHTTGRRNPASSIVVHLDPGSCSRPFVWLASIVGEGNCADRGRHWQRGDRVRRQYHRTGGAVIDGIRAKHLAPRGTAVRHNVVTVSWIKR